MSFGILDPAELQCCGQQMQTIPGSAAFICPICKWGVTKIEWLRAAHMQGIAKAIATKHLGRQF